VLPGTCKWLARDVSAAVEQNAPPQRPQTVSPANLQHTLDLNLQKARPEKVIAELNPPQKEESTAVSH
jgi:hypothetical protein